MNWLIDIVLIVLGVTLGWFVRPYLENRIKQSIALNKDLLANYLIPFKKWCRDLYKELTEFKERYTDENIFDNLSKSLIIIDYRELHEVLRDEGKYRGKIEKENPAVATYLKELENLVDNIWHSLQDDFSVNFNQSEYDSWIGAIIEYPEKKELVDAIKNKSEGLFDYLKNEEEFKKVTNYLLQQIPTW